jgi:hypothetical protein
VGSKNTPAGATTSTTTASPWAPQQPYLQSIFGQAQNLDATGGPAYFPGASQSGAAPDYGGPQYYNNSTVAPLNYGQQYALNQTQVDAQSPDFQSLTGGPSQLTNLELEQGSTNAADPALANGFLNSLAGGAGVNGGAQNPYTQALTQNIESSVVPSVESGFIQGGDLASPSAAYSVGQGVTNALAPSLFQNTRHKRDWPHRRGSDWGSSSTPGRKTSSAPWH